MQSSLNRPRVRFHGTTDVGSTQVSKSLESHLGALRIIPVTALEWCLKFSKRLGVHMPLHLFHLSNYSPTRFCGTINHHTLPVLSRCGAMASLAGYFLVARPILKDGNFSQSVVLLLQHGPEGAFGLVVN